MNTQTAIIIGAMMLCLVITILGLNAMTRWDGEVHIYLDMNDWAELSIGVPSSSHYVFEDAKSTE